MQKFYRTVIVINTKNAEVTLEASIGTTNKTMTEGGRIDLLIKSGNKVIVIENKIYADDQKTQMKRYQNFCQQYDDYRLLYLNLDGIEPSEDSIVDMVLDEDYHIISYSEDLLYWLEQCKKVCKNRMLVLSSIVQYSNLIKELTNQMNDNTEKELMSLLSSKDNMEKTAIILDRYQEHKDKLFEEQFVKKIVSWAKRQDMEVTDEYVNFPFAIRPKSWKNHWIVLESRKVRHAIQMYRNAGKVHKQIQLDSLNSGSTDKDWPFGYLWCTETLNSNEKIVNGEAYNEIKNVITSILNELEDKASLLNELNITL
ncbi:MAG: PD-(D/E)XK nuclease family protein [Bacteroidales bacterium]|nr:PD-(D/E)XK nuclease family protein [Bacteroidales bacterium]